MIALREEAGWTQETLAAVSNLMLPEVKLIELGCIDSSTNLSAITKAFCLPVDFFLQCHDTPGSSDLPQTGMQTCEEFHSLEDVDVLLRAEGLCLSIEFLADVDGCPNVTFRWDVKSAYFGYLNLTSEEQAVTCRNLVSQLRTIEGLGYSAKYCSYQTVDAYTACFVAFGPASDKTFTSLSKLPVALYREGLWPEDHRRWKESEED